MKKIIFLIFIVTISCQSSSDIQKQLTEQSTLLDYETKQIVNEIEAREIISPQKYSSFKSYSNEVIDETNKLISLVLECDKIEEKTLNSINKYFDFLSQNGANEDIQSTINMHQDLLIKTYPKYKKLNSEIKELIKLQLKGMQNYILNSMLAIFHKNSFTFDKIYPVIIPNKTELKKGEIYEARIILAAVDTFHLPHIEVEGFEIDMNSVFQGALKIKTNKEGRFVWNGTVTWLHENSGRAFCYPIQSYYDVK